MRKCGKFLLIAVMASPTMLIAQATPGMFADANHPSGASDPQKLDAVWNVDPINDQVSIKIPFVTTPQGGRGPQLPFSLLYNSTSTVTLQTLASTIIGYGTLATAFQWAAHPIGPGTSLVAPTGPWATSGPYFYDSYSNIPDLGFTDLNGAYHVTGVGCGITSPYIYVDADGAAHDMNLLAFSANPNSSQWAPPCGEAQSESATFWPTSSTTDGSVLFTNTGLAIGPDGTQTTGTSLSNGGVSTSSKVTDSNGNYANFVISNGVTTATDAIGRTVYQTNIPVGHAGQIPPGTYYVTTYSPSGGAENYSVVVSTIAIGSFKMPHPTVSEILSPSFCTSCNSEYTISQPKAGDTLTAVTEVDLPNGTSYRLSYDPTYGTISKITFPTGGYVRFVWGIRDEDWSPYGQYGTISAVVVTDAYVYDGSQESHWTYDMESLSTSPTPVGRVHAPDSSRTDYTGTCLTYTAIPMYQTQAKSSCKEASRAIYDSTGTLVKSVGQRFNGEGLPLQIATSVYDGASPLQQLEQMTYDIYDNVVEKDESDFYTCSGHPCPNPSQSSSLPAPSNGWLRKTFTSYSNSKLTSAHIVNKPSQVLVTDGGGHPFSLAAYGYDETSVSGPAGYKNHDDTNYGAGSSVARGNVTTESHCVILNQSSSVTPSSASSACSQWWTTTYTYDLAGQMLTKLDPKVGTTQFDYTDNYSGTNLSFATDAYVTTVTHPGGFKDLYSYYYYTGERASHTDWNTRKTSYSYGDPMNRLSSVSYPDGGGVSYSYTDSTPPSVTSTQQISGSTTLQRVTQFDALGRVSQTKLASDASGADYVDTTYDLSGRVYSVSNPHRSSTSQTDGITYSTYDALGRPSLKTNPDQTTTKYTYAGNVVTFTDEKSNQWSRAYDGLGRLTQVLEPTQPSTPPSLETDYSYDPLSNLTLVNQKGASGDIPRVRNFAYDGMSRLVSAANAETGTSSYKYLSAGVACAGDPSLPCSKTDARGVTITYNYDALNRLLSKSYSSGDLSSCFQYDKTASTASDSNPNGNLTMEWTQAGSCPGSQASSLPSGAVSSRVVLAHDAMNRVLSEQQCPIAPCSTNYQFAYGYDLAGNLVSSNNGMPAGNSTTAPAISWGYDYDGANRLAQVSVYGQPWSDPAHPSILFQANQNTYSVFQTAPYDPLGHLAIAGMGVTTNGNGGTIVRTGQSDSRGRITSISYGVNGAVPATGSTGIINISGGPEKSLWIKRPGTSGTGTIQISGYEGYRAGDNMTSSPSCHVSNPPSTCFVYDSGNVTVTVGSFTASVPYGQDYTATVIAQNLLYYLNSSNSPVTASITSSSSGSATISMTAKATGASSNYPISGNSNSTVFLGSSFSATPSSSTLTGGASSLSRSCLAYDIGHLSATITNNAVTPPVTYVATVPWGRGDSAFSLAGKLSSAINSVAGSVVSASPDPGNSTGLNSSNVDLVSAGTGVSTDYPMSVSSGDAGSYSYFISNPSFSIGSGTALNGGTNTQTNFTTVYSYGAGYDSAGNVQTISDTVMGNWQYGYDSLNRLTSGIPSSGPYAGQYDCWAYDAFGNRTMEVLQNSPCSTAAKTAAFDNPSNRVTWTSNTGAGFGYDAGGDVTSDPLNSYAYDGEGRLCAVRNYVGAIEQYVYDAEGRRVAKGTRGDLTCPSPSSANGFTLANQYLLGPGGEQVSELSGSGSWMHSNVYGAGLLATYASSGTAFSFHMTDPLGSRRVLADATGTVLQSCQNQPFGNGETCSPSPTEHLFTGKERDPESGNDYFGARYYASTMGRFLSPDSGSDQHPANPQSWNLYTYGRNNPLVMIDPSGNYVCGSSMTAGQCDQFQGYINHAQEAANTLKDKYGADSTQYTDAQRAIDAYGKENVDNGVTVNIGATGGYGGTTTATDGAAKTDLNPTGQNIQVTINSGLFGSNDATGISATIAHEGSHVGDAQDWAKAGFTDAANPTHFNTEFRAYGVTTGIMDAFGSTRLSASHGNQMFHDFWMKNATDVYNNQIGRPAMIKMFYPNWAEKAFQKNTQGGGQ